VSVQFSSVQFQITHVALNASLRYTAVHRAYLASSYSVCHRQSQNDTRQVIR